MKIENRTAPIVVAAFRAVCDYGQHDVEVITDGTRVVSASPDRYGTRNTHGVSRIDSEFILTCNVPDARTGESCGGLLTVDTADPGAWRAATPEDASWLDTDAQEVDHA
jgi:hypothetical protein